ncbi:unnamed protein product [Arctia plantaginis]|uniref:Peptidase S1 domain-containing protein n=1 Tax=Arctia plantaginis TaxID=874455 RepID=A0A8S1BP52_ARCPL|nr:unnamed protein product [Arctia plantaginis]
MDNLTSVCLCVFMCVFVVKSELYEEDSCYSEIDRLNGTCVHIHRCLSTVNDFKKGIKPQLCSFDGQKPIICCTDCELIGNTSLVWVNDRGVYFFKTGSKAQDKCIEHVANLRYPCYTSTGVKRMLNFISRDCYQYLPSFELTTVGGENAERGEFPHMASLGYGDSIERAEWVCGGSVISDRFILTAAHCIFSSKLGPVKYIGLGTLKRSDPLKTWQLYNVSRIIPHPQYKSPSKYHDIALLETETQIKFNIYVLPACLSLGNDDESLASATGWGAIGYRKDLADNLQVIYLQQFSEDECSTAYPSNRNLQRGYDHTIQSCYGDKSHVINTCQELHRLELRVVPLAVLECTPKWCNVSWIENIVWP